MERIDNCKQKELDIVQIAGAEEKRVFEPSLRSLWRECFGDSSAYEDFYFSKVYPDNVVYTVRDKAMLHLNPYTYKVRGKEMELQYIVGVATTQAERRKGWMRRLIAKALKDAYEKGIPFTYLMPADVKYYQPFDFISIYEKQEANLPLWGAEGDVKNLEADGRTWDWQSKEYDASAEKLFLKGPEGCWHFMKYDTLISEWSGKQQEKLSARMNEMLAKKYDVYALRNKRYLELLYQEKQCQNGNVVFCFCETVCPEHLVGWYAYGLDEKNMTMYVEQYVFEKNLSEDTFRQICHAYYKWLQGASQKEAGYLQNVKEMSLVHQYPFMIRIVHLETFLQVYKAYFAECARKEIVLCIEDSILSGNNGMYMFSMKEEEIVIEKGDEQTGEGYRNESRFITVSIIEVADYVWQQIKEEHKRIFFGEVV